MAPSCFVSYHGWGFYDARRRGGMRVQGLVIGGVVAAISVLAAIATFHEPAPSGEGASRPVETAERRPLRTESPPTRRFHPSVGERDPLAVPLAPTKAGNVPSTDASSEEARDAIEFCLPMVLPRSPCLTRGAILALDDRPVDRLTADGVPRYAEVTLVHPTDYMEPERVVEGCKAFGRLKVEDWGPLTTAGRAQEARFERYCGLMALAEVAEVPRSSRFDGNGLSRAELEAVPVGQWPRLGEAAPKAPIFSQDDEANPRRWVGDTETLHLMVFDVAHADFDGDGLGERLLNIAGRARGGSAGFAGYYLLEQDDHGIGLRRVKWE